MEIIQRLNGAKSNLVNERARDQFSPLLKQILASLGPLILFVANGMTTGYSSILLPQLEHKNSSISITPEQSYWIASMAALTMALSCFLLGFLFEKAGRRTVIIITTIPFAIGWILIGAAVNLEMILVGRFITGLCSGFVSSAVSVYIAEISTPKYRGLLLGGMGVSVALGVLLSHLMGTFMSWKLVAYLSSIAPIVCVGLLMFFPESPTWLASKGEFKKSEEAFFWFRGSSTEAIEEFDAMIEKQTKVTTDKVTWTSCKKREFWKPLIVLSVFFITSQFTGIAALMFYAVSVMQNTVGEGIDEYVAMNVVDLVRFFAHLLACVLTNKYGRRPLTNFGCLGTFVALLVLSIFLYISQSYPHIRKFPGIPLSALIGYAFFVSVGLIPIPWVVMGEILPLGLKGVGSGIATFSNFVAIFLVVKTNPMMNLYLQPAGTFLVYGLLTGIGGVILYIFLPETKGKTLQQIEEQSKKP